MQGLLSAGREGGARLLLALFLQLQLSASTCPCQDPSLCNPISGSKDFEVFVFDVGGKTWKFYDWSQITTVATFGKYDPELMCYAHSKGARVVLKGDVSVKEIVDPFVRAAWIGQQIDLAKKQYMDGINIDIEQEVNKSSAEYYALTALVKETTEAFHKEIPGSQVTFDVAWSPECIDKRCYNYSGIADSCDFVFVMSYDEQSQVWTECIAGANAPYNQTLAGYDDYLDLGINPKKLVMGVPWYGYDYTCLHLSMDSHNASHQVWFDNPRSISLKAAYVKEHGLRGIGMWNGNCLDYSGGSVARKQTEAMWEALKPK
ncbi:di-N-acetylchitobiase isoform X2 [Hemicordylus capensis]|uniref:di-N-acetylchitobiase isoform X2 n=1 Tax=Hemicordylus capensis TaxID=884348 RepID=UPI002304AC23|nr:di-N-acetylchitobiase isoform X2 [Hemicordylus capensis]